MSQLLIPDLDEVTLSRLREQASKHGRSIEVEAKLILAAALPANTSSVWVEVNKQREKLAANGRTFPDSTDSIREDRSR